MKAKNHRRMNDKLKGFSLVELIVVITILVILGTIAFIQLGGFASSARDGRRVSDMSNITQSIELSVVTQGSAPIPTDAKSYAGGSITVQMGIINNSTIPRMSGDFSDPVTKAPYNYSVFGNGLYYQLGIDFENPLSLNSPGQGEFRGFGIETVYADAAVKYSKLSGSYKFDPSLPSLFFLTGAQNTASGGIFSPDVCFVMNNVSTNTFSSSNSGCLAKKNMNLNTMDSSLVGYWDMETFSGTMLKDLSGNGNNLLGINRNFDGSTSSWNINNSLTGGISGKALTFSGGTLPTFQYLSGSKINLGTGQYALSMIIKPDLPIDSIPHAIISINDPFVTFLRIWHFTTNHMIKVLPDILLWSELDGKISLQNNFYYKIDCIFDGINQKTYINGKLDNSMKILGTSIASNTGGTIMIGASTWINDPYNGIIDDVKIYNRALSDDEIKQQAKVAGF